MNVHALKNYIINNSELIELILEKSGFHHIDDKYSGGIEYRCAWDEDGNPTSVRVNKETLSSTYFKTGLQGDIITLVKEKKGISFPKTLDFISSIINFEDEDEIEYDLAFSGLFLELEQIYDTGEYIKLDTYEESTLDDFLIMPSMRFLEDGIDYQTQVDFKIGYDLMTNRIIVPWRSLKGDLIGIMGRLNKDEIEPYESKWLPVIAFPKSKTLFGFSQNYSNIQSSKTVMLWESEKGVMKSQSQGINCTLALGGNSLSDYQVNNINSLFPDKIIVGLDEGLSEEQSVHLAEKLKYNTYFENNVFYLYDKLGLYLKKGSKMSPSDLPKEDLKSMIMNCAKKV